MEFSGPLCSLMAAMTWAFGSIGYSQLSKKYSVFAINFARALISLPLFIATACFVSGGFVSGWVHFRDVSLSSWGWLGLSTLASYGFGDALFFWSTRSLGVPSALAIASSYPVWTVLAGYFLLNQSISLGQGFGLAFTLVGMVIVVFFAPPTEIVPTASQASGAPQGQSEGYSILGLGLALAASLAWATNSFAVSRGGTDLMPAVGNVIRMGFALLLSSTCGRVFSPRSKLILPRREIVRFFWFFLIEAFLGSSLYLYGLSHSPLALGATLSSLAPVISVPFALIFGLESFSFYRTLGVVFAAIGVCFLVR